jgi:hypothetical protein
VKTYTILVRDRGGRDPVCLLAELAHDTRAVDFARERLASSPRYVAIEVWRDGEQLFEARSEREARATSAA